MTRRMYRFWLNDAKDDEAQLVGQVEDLKAKRQYTATIRQGLQLITSLRAGRLDTLFSMFPWVQAEFLEFVNKLQPTATRGEVGQGIDDTQLQRERQAIEDEKKRLHDLKLQLERIEQRIDDKLGQVGQVDAPPTRSALQPVATGRGLQPVATNTHAGMTPLTNNKLTPGLQPLNVPQFNTPSYDDEDDDLLLTVTQHVGGGQQAAENFLKSMQALQG